MKKNKELPKSLRCRKGKVYAFIYRLDKNSNDMLDQACKLNKCARTPLLNRLLLFYKNAVLGTFPKDLTIVDYMNALKECNGKMAKDNEVILKK